MKTYRASRVRLIVLSICALLLGQTSDADAQDLFDSIVQKFPASDTGHVVKNLPFARPRVLPGAIFTTSLRLPIVYGLPGDPQIISGPPTEYQGEVADELMQHKSRMEPVNDPFRKHVSCPKHS
jgi:hypothetical protein